MTVMNNEKYDEKYSVILNAPSSYDDRTLKRELKHNVSSGWCLRSVICKRKSTCNGNGVTCTALGYIWENYMDYKENGISPFFVI